ncbi:hypothetical protein D3C75_1377410 [compost metagenome]
MDQFIRCQADLGQTLLDPGERQRQHGAVPLQATNQLGDKGAGAWGIGARHIGNHHDQVGRIVFR